MTSRCRAAGPRQALGEALRCGREARPTSPIPRLPTPRFTLLPIRMAGSLLIVLRGGWSRLTPFQYCELLRGLLITVVSYMVLMIDMSQAYHTVRNQAMIKLYAAPHAQEGRPPWLGPSSAPAPAPAPRHRRHRRPHRASLAGLDGSPERLDAPKGWATGRPGHCLESSRQSKAADTTASDPQLPTHTHAHTRARTHTHTHTHIYMDMHAPADTHTHTSSYGHACTSQVISIRTCMHLSGDLHMDMHAPVR